jgi:cytochrome c biogenesis protein CcdA
MASSIGPDFFNNACAVLPILLLTKVADKARREAKAAREVEGAKPRRAVAEDTHRLFVVVALAGEAAAFIGSLLEGSRDLVALVVGVVLVACGLLFGYELWRPDGADDRVATFLRWLLGMLCRRRRPG